MDEKIKAKVIQKWKDAKDLFVVLMDKPVNLRDVSDRIMFIRILDMVELEECR